jgi:hypothetical protein
MNGRSYELTLTVDTYGGVSAVNENDKKREGVLCLDGLPRATIRLFEDWLREKKITRRRELEVLGAFLYAALFNGDIPNFFATELREAEQARQRLRLRLNFEGNNAHLISLPWEFLYYPPIDDFMATCANLVLSRYLRSDRGKVKLTPDQSTLRILVAVSRPTDEDDVTAKEVVRAIEGLAQNDLATVEVETEQEPTVPRLKQQLHDFKPHVLHFIGHGRYITVDDEGKGQIALLGEDGKALWCEDFELLRYMREAQALPRLIFLDMCDGGQAGVDRTVIRTFSGFAPKLLNANIPAVVAMQYPISNRDARTFSRAFYEELAQGHDIDAAVQVGRMRITDYNKDAYNSRVIGTPVIYMHSIDGSLIQPKALPRDSEASNPAPQRQGDTAGGAVNTAELVERLRDMGIRTLFQLQLAGDQATTLYDRVGQLVRDFQGKTSEYMKNVLVDIWQKERHQEAKKVWWAMLMEIKE